MRQAINWGSPWKPIRLRDWPLENLWGGEEGEVPKNIRKGKIKWKEIHVCQLSLKNIHSIPPQKIHTRNLITKKNSCGSKIPHPSPPLPTTFLMVRPCMKRTTFKIYMPKIRKKRHWHWKGNLTKHIQFVYNIENNH